MKYLPESWENLFQRMKRLIRHYEEVNGKGSSINIAVGEPDTNPPELLRKFVAEEVMREDNVNHTYWDNRTTWELNENLIEITSGVDIRGQEHLATLLLPWEKSMIGLLLIACGANRNDLPVDNVGYIRTAPSYDLVGTWSEYLWEESDIWSIYSHENFRLKVENLPQWKKPRMIMTVKPWNPCPVWASKEEWEEVIEYCVQNKIRLVNDGAYTGVVHKNHIPLSAVAKNYKELEWIELFSISKTFSACGWRLWIAVGSKDFIAEFTKIKGNSDSGGFGPLIVGLAKYLKTDDVRREAKLAQELYKKRLDILTPIFENSWFKLACPSDAGFFMLFHCPTMLNGEKVETSEQFNQKMIEVVGLVGVPFVGSEINGEKEQFIRYSACYNALDEQKVKILKEALGKINISYS